MTTMLPCCQGKSPEEVLQDIMNIPHEMFAVDLLFYLSNESKELCLPECNHLYEIQATSPLTEDIRRYIEAGFKQQDPFYNFMYQTYKSGCDSESAILASFSRDMVRELREFSSEDSAQNIPMNFVLSKVVHVAKFSIEFHKQGTKGVLSFALRNIAQALEECNRRNNGQIFKLLSKYASDVISSIDSEKFRAFPLM